MLTRCFRCLSGFVFFNLHFLECVIFYFEGMGNGDWFIRVSFQIRMVGSLQLRSRGEARRGESISAGNEIR